MQTYLSPDYALLKQLLCLASGGDSSCLFHFEIVWPLLNLVNSERLEKLTANFVKQPKKLRLAVTLADTPTPRSRYESRIQTPGCGEKWLHRRLGMFGSSSFGEVHKSVNMHTGDYYAVKVLLRHAGKITNDVAWRKDVLREVTTLQRLYHVSSHVPCAPGTSLFLNHLGCGEVDRI